MLRHAVLAIAMATPAVSAPVSLSAACPKGQGDDIIVCADPDPRPSPYRLPIPLPPEFGTAGSVSVSRERNALFDYDAGGSGVCSNVGAGGAWGCLAKQHKSTTEQRANARDKRGRLYDGP